MLCGNGSDLLGPLTFWRIATKVRAGGHGLHVVVYAIRLMVQCCVCVSLRCFRSSGWVLMLSNSAPMAQMSFWAIILQVVQNVLNDVKYLTDIFR